MICDDCGKDKEDVVNTICPYAEELYGEIHNITVCEDCLGERVMDI